MIYRMFHLSWLWKNLVMFKLPLPALTIMALFLWVHKLSYYCPIAKSHAQCVWSENKGIREGSTAPSPEAKMNSIRLWGLMVCEPHRETRTREKCDHFTWPNKHCWITGMGQEGDKMLCEISQYTMHSFWVYFWTDKVLSFLFVTMFCWASFVRI